MNGSIKLATAYVLGAAAGVVILLAGGTQAAEQDPELIVTEPFDSITSIDNLRKCIKVEDDDAPRLAQIRSIAYQFDPPGGATQVRRTGGVTQVDQRVTIERSVRMASNDLSADRIIRQVEALRGGNCEKDTKIWSISVRLAEPNRIAVSFATRVDFRDCGSFLGIEYKNDIGSAGAYVDLSYRVAEDFSLIEDPPVYTQQWSDTNWFYEALGQVLPAMGPIGAVISFQIKAQIANASMANSGGTFAQSFRHEFQAMAAGFETAKDFAHDVNLLNAPVWNFQRVPARSGLVELGGSQSTLLLTESVSILPIFGPPTYRMKKAEIKAVYELRFPRPRIHVVERGDNLWKVAKKYYSEPKMFALIESATALKRSTIRPGQQLVVPYYTELCQQTNEGRIVRPGDTVWGLMQRHTDYKPQRRDFRSRRLDLIYPFETVQLPTVARSDSSGQAKAIH